VSDNVFAPDTAVRLAVLGGDAPLEIVARILEASSGRVLVATTAPLQPGMPVRIQGDDTLLLGEVYGVDRRENEWIAAVKIAHSLRSLAALERFNRTLLGNEPELIPSLRSTAE
jgi:hypothetical protein